MSKVYPVCKPALGTHLCERCGRDVNTAEGPCHAIPEEQRWTMESPVFQEQPSNKPEGKYKCRACRQVWDGSELHLSPFHTGTTWTCADYFCGGTCDPVRS